MLVQVKGSFSYFLQNIYVWFIVIGTLMRVSARNWVVLWVGLELNMIAFLGLMRESGNLLCFKWGYGLNRVIGASVSSDSLAKYFLAQSVGTGIFLLFPLLGGDLFRARFFLSSVFFCCGLLLKGGVAPFHQWFPSVCSRISWYLNLVLLTWQKIAPLFILSQFSISYMRMVFIGIVNLFFGVFGALGQTQFRPLIAYSSIAHIGWIVCLMYYSGVAFFYYFICYLIVVSPVVGIFINSNLFSFKGLMGGAIGRFNIFIITLLLLRISGIPPFLGFFIKAYALFSIIKTTAFVVALVYCLFAAISLSYYLNLCFIILMSTSYSLSDEDIWAGGIMSSREDYVFWGFYLLGVISLAGLPYARVFVL